MAILAVASTFQVKQEQGKAEQEAGVDDVIFDRTINSIDRLGIGILMAVAAKSLTPKLYVQMHWHIVKWPPIAPSDAVRKSREQRVLGITRL